MSIIGVIILYIINAITYLNGAVGTEFFMLTTVFFAVVFVIAVAIEYWFIARRQYVAMLSAVDDQSDGHYGN